MRILDNRCVHKHMHAHGHGQKHYPLSTFSYRLKDVQKKMNKNETMRH